MRALDEGPHAHNGARHDAGVGHVTRRLPRRLRSGGNAVSNDRGIGCPSRRAPAALLPRRANVPDPLSVAGIHTRAAGQGGTRPPDPAAVPPLRHQSFGATSRSLMSHLPSRRTRSSMLRPTAATRGGVSLPTAPNAVIQYA